MKAKKKRLKATGTVHMTHTGGHGGRPNEATARTTGVASSGGTTDTKSLVFGASCAKNGGAETERSNRKGSVNGCGIAEGDEENPGNVAQTTASTANPREIHNQVEQAGESLRLRVEAGQASPRTKLNDQTQDLITGFILSGGSWQDACALAGVHRSSATEWKARGQRFLDDPIKHPGDERFGQFVRACEEAALKVKLVLLRKICADPDWKAATWYLVNKFPLEFRSQHLSIEQSGPGGGPIPISQQPFRVEVHLSGPENPEFRTVEHRNDNEREASATSHVESQVIAPPPEVFEAPAEKIEAPAKLNPFDPLGPRTWEKGLHS